MTHKATTKFYSAAVSDRELPGIYYGTFGVPGEMPRWVLEKGERKTFRSADEAELAGWRVMASHLNRSQCVQDFKVKQDKTRVYRNYEPGNPARQTYARSAEVDRVFGRSR